MIVVIDGLRPDSIDPRDTPHLDRLRREGTEFTNAHAVFPTGTRVNAAALVTGTYPDRNGLLGNTVRLEGESGDRVLDTQRHRDLLDASTRGSRVLLAETLGDMLARRGKTLAAVSTASTGSSLLLNPGALEGEGLLVNGAFEPGVRVAYPDDINRAILDRFGPAPRKAGHGRLRAGFVQWTHRVLMDFIVPDLGPDVVVDWISEPDHTQHAFGVGSPQGRRALAEVDRQVGYLLHRLEDLGLSGRANLFVLSDHGATRYGGSIDVERSLSEAMLVSGRESDEVVVTANGPSAQIHVAGHDRERIREIVAFLQGQEWCGPLFTGPRALRARAADPAAAPTEGWGEPFGSIEGTFSLDFVHLFHPQRSCDVLVTFPWTSTPNGFGVPGTEVTTAVRGKRALHSGHGGASPWAIRSTMIAAGPDLKAGSVISTPVGHVDLVPTVLSLVGAEVPAGLAGRVLGEALVGGPDAGDLQGETRTFRTSAGDAAYRAAVQLSRIDGYRYLDHASRPDPISLHRLDRDGGRVRRKSVQGSPRRPPAR